MSARAKQHEEEGGGEVGLWYVSFADMITLLLSFFVMLTSFSSYDTESLSRIQAASGEAGGVIRVNNAKGRNSLVDPVHDSARPTAGTEQARLDDQIQTMALPPSSDEGPSAKSTMKLRIEGSKLFPAGSTELSGEGRASAAAIAKLMNVVPCHAMISVVLPASASKASAAGGGEELWLARQYALLAALTEAGHVPAERLALAGGHSFDPLAKSPCVTVTLMGQWVLQ